MPKVDSARTGLHTLAVSDRLTPQERKIRAVQRALLKLPATRADLEAQLLGLELGGTNHAAVADAWKRAADADAEYRRKLALM